MAANGPVYADAWTLTERGRASADYDDNVLLSYDDAIETAKLSAEAAASLARQDDAFRLRIEPRIATVRYLDAAEFDYTAGYLRLNARQTSERSSLEFALDGTQDTTLTSEEGSTGLTQVNKYHRSAVLSVTPSLQWTERLAAGGQVYATVHRYVDAELTGLIDYDYGMAAGSMSYGLGELSRLSLQISAGKLRVPDDSGYDKTNFAATLTYTKQFDEHWQAVVSFGPSEIRTDAASNSGVVYEVSATRKSELFNMSAAIKREVTPTGQGALTRRDEASLGFYRSLSERASLNVGGRWIRNRNVLPSGGLELNAVRYAGASARFNWSLAPTWSLSLSFGYTQQSHSWIDDTARRRDAGLSLNWSGLERVL